jgi:hypothetical protein
LNGIGGRTIAEARERMSASEFKQWVAFFSMYPFDDAHRYHRPAAVVAHSFGGKYDDVLEFLSPEPLPPGMSAADARTMRSMMKLVGR